MIVVLSFCTSFVLIKHTKTKGLPVLMDVSEISSPRVITFVTSYSVQYKRLHCLPWGTACINSPGIDLKHHC